MSRFVEALVIRPVPSLIGEMDNDTFRTDPAFVSRWVSRHSTGCPVRKSSVMVRISSRKDLPGV